MISANKHNKDTNQITSVWELANKISLANDIRAKLCLEPIIELSLGEPHLPINQCIIDSFIERVMHSSIKKSFYYSPIVGREETLISIISLYKYYYPKVIYSPEEVMCTNGGNQAIWNALWFSLKNVDFCKREVIVFEPYFSNYHQQIESLGVKLIKIPTEKNKFRPDSGLLLDVINKNPNANVLILNNPNNPSGVVLYEQEMVEIGEVMLRFPHIIIILDEVYRDLSYVKFISLLDVFPELKARTIVINSCSKGLIGAPDMRIGMVGASKEFITGMAAAQSLSTASVSLFSQLALISGITIKLEGNNLCWETTAINEYKKNMQILSDGFNFGKAPISLVNIPRGGFFALINMRKFIDLRINKASFGSAVSLLYEKIGSDALSDDSAISNYLLYVAGVAVTPGSNFGIDPNLGYVRVSYAVTADKIKKACSNIHKAFFQLKN